jgi:lipoprotein NlpI
MQAAESTDRAEQKERVCEAQFYVGEYALLQGKTSEAEKFFKAAFEGCPTNFVEYVGAKAELDRLPK